MCSHLINGKIDQKGMEKTLGTAYSTLVRDAAIPALK
jgi:hypothetical protein